ncbi:hypothetical protein ABZ826_14915 [Streptomyces sp. NPDC047515]|uniref:hypothetical protein n=1 Tax=Streptomyces sp. NPDC047515 TaxID=3155380 RepID=UPI0033C91036
MARLILSDEERAALEGWVRRRSTPQAWALRCRIILACAEGISNKDVAVRLGSTAHAYVVHYTIRNGGSGAANYYARFEFLDKDGDVLGKTGVTADKLGPGKTKTGESAPLDSEIEHGTVKDIASVRVAHVERT